MDRARYAGVAVSHQGATVVTEPYAQIKLYVAGTGTPTGDDGTALTDTIYASVSGGTTLTNPFFADVDGNFVFYLASAKALKIVATGPTIGTLVRDYEHVEGSPGQLLGDWIGESLNLSKWFKVYNSGVGNAFAIDTFGRVRMGNGNEANAYVGSGYFGKNTAFGISFNDTTDVEGGPNQVTFDVVHYNDNRGLFTLFTGAAASGSTNTLTSTTGGFGINVWAGCTITITGGTGTGQSRRILSHTDTVITTKSNWTTPPDATSTYEITGLLTNGTASSGGATTLTDSSKTDWTASEFIGYAVRILSGTGAGQARDITANTTTQLTVNPAWSVTPNSTSVYEIRKVGDDGVARFVQQLSSTAITSTRSVEIHTSRASGSPHKGTLGLELSVGVADTIPDPIYARGISITSFSSFIFGGGGARAGIGIHMLGSNGWDEYTRFDNTAGTSEFKTYNGGHSFQTGRLAVGRGSVNTNALDVKQTYADNLTGGFKLAPSDTDTAYITMFHGPSADRAAYIEMVNGSEVSLYRFDPRSAQPTIQINAASSHTGLLFQLLRESNSKFEVDKDGNTNLVAGGTLSISGNQVVKARMSDPGILGAASYTAVPASFADLAAVRTYLVTHLSELTTRDGVQTTKINEYRNRISAAAGGHGLTD